LLINKVKALPRNFWFILFVALFAQLTLIWLGTAAGDPYGDVRYTYDAWVTNMIQHHFLLGINEPWVYPFIAEVPLWLAHFVWPADYMTGWFILVVNVNMIMIAYLLGWGKATERFKSAWFLIACIFLCGPVALGRFEVFSLALAVLAAVSYVNRRDETLSMQFFNLATWIKVSPLAALASGFVITDKKIKFVRNLAIGTVAILAVGLLLGGNSAMFSFIGMQSGRGIQVESSIAILWLVQILVGIPGSKIVYDNNILTFQVTGAGVAEIASIMTLVQFGALAITLWLGFRAKKQGVHKNTLFAWMFLTSTLDLLVFNKVGSPQYELWLVGAAVAGLIAGTKNWKFVTYMTLFTSGLSWLIFPIFYGDLLDGKPFGVGLLILRNLGVIAVLVYSNQQLIKLGKTKREAA
jgi:uncharacterized protein (DUF2062 family)